MGGCTSPSYPWQLRVLRQLLVGGSQCSAVASRLHSVLQWVVSGHVGMWGGRGGERLSWLRDAHLQNHSLAPLSMRSDRVTAATLVTFAPMAWINDRMLSQALETASISFLHLHIYSSQQSYLHHFHTPLPNSLIALVSMSDFLIYWYWWQRSGGVLLLWLGFIGWPPWWVMVGGGRRLASPSCLDYYNEHGSRRQFKEEPPWLGGRSCC